jgi:hypothetical protein
VPLYPFASLQEVAAWQQNYRANGSQAQYLDERATALAFTKFLGYTAVDRVVTSRDDTAGARLRGLPDSRERHARDRGGNPPDPLRERHRRPVGGRRHR